MKKEGRRIPVRQAHPYTPTTVNSSASRALEGCTTHRARRQGVRVRLSPSTCPNAVFALAARHLYTGYSRPSAFRAHSTTLPTALQAPTTLLILHLSIVCRPAGRSGQLAHSCSRECACSVTRCRCGVVKHDFCVLAKGRLDRACLLQSRYQWRRTSPLISRRLWVGIHYRPQLIQILHRIA